MEQEVSDKPESRNRKDAKAKRLADALRANLKRRKEQSRAQREPNTGNGKEETAADDETEPSSAASIQPQGHC